jgi:Tfp pilus assembly protein PilW
MVSLAILGIVTLQILGMVYTQQRQASAHREVVEVQEDVRLVSDMMLADIRMAGFLLPTSVGISSIDGGNSDADIVCMSDASIINPTEIASATDRFGGALITVALGASDGSVTVAVADLDIDGDGNDDFAEDAGVIVSDGTRSHCARITGIGGGVISFTPATPSGFSVASGAGVAVPAIVYEVTGAGLHRNDMLFSAQVEDLQIEFGVDLNGDGDLTGELPVDSLDGSSTDRVLTVRLTVVTRTTRDDLGIANGGRPAIANRDAGPADTLRRRIAVNTIAPRNFL